MKKICIIIFYILSSLRLYADHIPKAYRKYFVNCCNNRKTSIRSLIDINGYFTLGIVEFSTNGKVDTSYNNMLFYEDGFCVIGWSGYEGQSSNLFLDEVNKVGSKHYFYENAIWGKYEIKGDTIVIRDIMRATIMRPVSVDEVWYKVVNRKTISRIYYKSLEVRHKQNREDDLHDRKIKYLPAYFTQYDHLPPSEYAWIKKQKCKICD